MNKQKSNNLRLTPRGERLAGVWSHTREIGKKGLAAAVATGSVLAVSTIAYDSIGPKDVTHTSLLDIGSEPTTSGDIDTINDALIGMGEDPNKLRNAGTEAQSARSEAENAGSTVAKITVYESPVFGNESVKITFPESPEK